MLTCFMPELVIGPYDHGKFSSQLKGVLIVHLPALVNKMIAI